MAAQAIALPSTISVVDSVLAKSVSQVLRRNSSANARIEIAGAVASSAQPHASSTMRSVAGRVSANVPLKNATAATMPTIERTIQPVGATKKPSHSRRATVRMRCIRCAIEFTRHLPAAPTLRRSPRARA